MPDSRTAALSNSALIRTKIHLCSGAMEAEAARFWMHAAFPTVYQEYILQSYSVIRASVPLMEAAARACRLPEFADDPVCQGFGAYLDHHAPEEAGHHHWILDDGETLGMSRQWILRHPPRESPMQLVGLQYYLLNHVHPISLAGYIAVMEGTPPPVDLIHDVARRNGLPLKAFSSFLLHAKIDPVHREDLNRVLDALPLTAEHHSLIGVSVVRTIRYLKSILEDINQSDKAGVQSRLGAAVG